MRKILVALFVSVFAVVGMVSPAQASAKHNIKQVGWEQQMNAWDALDQRFAKAPNVQKSFLKQGSRISVVGKSKTATSTFPMRSIKANGGGYWVFSVSPVTGKDIKLNAKQLKDLKRVLPACSGSKKVNCYKGNTVKFPNVNAVKR